MSNRRAVPRSIMTLYWLCAIGRVLRFQMLQRWDQHRPAEADRLCGQGWFGQKTGRGWYRYPEGARTGVHDPEVEAIIEA